MSLIRVAHVELSGDGDELVIGRGLRLQFAFEEVIGTFGGEPSSVKVYNLSQETISRIADGMMARLIAGYDDDNGVVDEGVVIRSRTYTSGLERVTDLQIIKREVDTRAKFMVQYPEGPVRLRQIVMDCLDAMGAVAESLDAIPDETLPEFQASPNAAKKVLEDLLKSRRIGKSSRRGTIIFHPEGAPTPGATTHKVSEFTGLIGSPSASEQGASAVIHFDRTIGAGDQIDLVSRDVSGSFRAQKVVHAGDSYGTEPWTTKVELATMDAEASS